MTNFETIVFHADDETWSDIHNAQRENEREGTRERQNRFNIFHNSDVKPINKTDIPILNGKTAF